MFSVKATPFNSASRQLYGGWTLPQAGNDAWAVKKWAEMAKKYATDPMTRYRASAILRGYRRYLRQHPDVAPMIRANFRRRSRAATADVIRPPMTDDAKNNLWELWENVPMGLPGQNNRIDYKMLKDGPFPNYQMMNLYHNLGLPYENPMAVIPFPASYQRGVRNWDALRAGRRIQQLRNRGALRAALGLHVGDRIPIDREGMDRMMQMMADPALARPPQPPLLPNPPLIPVAPPAAYQGIINHPANQIGNDDGMG